jgi:tetratricopeptide (TPR) repeat protein
MTSRAGFASAAFCFDATEQAAYPAVMTRAFLTLVSFIALWSPLAAQSSSEPRFPSGSSPSKASPAPQAERQAITANTSAKQALDDLFKRLKGAPSAEEAKGIASQIERRWQRSGSDTADLLMSRAQEAIREKGRDLPLAVELLDRVVANHPEWVEAWHQRGTAFFLLGDTERAIRDLQQVLAREPRHFNALSGLGYVLLGEGDRKRALEIFRKALDVHPHIEDLGKTVERLAPDVDGRDT